MPNRSLKGQRRDLPRMSRNYLLPNKPNIAHEQTIICRQLTKDREHTTWPANNCRQIMVCSCAMSSNCMCLAANNILFMRKRNHAFLLLVIAVAKNGRSLHLFSKKQTRWSNDKTIFELSYLKISWFVTVSQINYLPQPICGATYKSRYLAQTRPIIASYFCMTVNWPIRTQIMELVIVGLN